MKAVTKFSGGGGVDLGMIAAGWEHTYGIEYDARIAQVARDNGLNTITADILKIKPEDYAGMDWMHDSPPCPNFSTAKANGEETENDIALAQAVCDWIVYHRPRFYTLENVYGYRKSKSWAMIADTLHRQGYLFQFWHVNMADYGIIERCPIHHALENTRKNAQYAETYFNHASKMSIAPDIVQQSAKMQADAQARILAWDVAAELVQLIKPAIVGGVTRLKTDHRLHKINGEKITIIGKVGELLTNADTSALGLTDDMLESIGLLLSKSLEENSLMERLFTTSTEIQQTTVLKILKCLLTIPNIFHTTTTTEQNVTDGGLGTSGDDCPLCKIKGVPQTRKRMIVIARRDGIMPQLPPQTHAENPTPGLFGTLKRWVSWYEAIEDLIPTLPDSQFAPWQLERLPDESSCEKYQNKAFIVGNGTYSSSKENKPADTITSNSNQTGVKAFVVNDQRSHDGAKVMNLTNENPSFVVDTRQASKTRAFANGRVVKMTPRALARFQSFPDWYELPESNTLAARIIGNAVPPLFMQRVGEMLADAYK